MPELDDQQLLTEFSSNNSEPAFATLVERYVNLVYSTALRFTGNPQAAEEISQAVFIILARKAAGLRSGVVLSGWLYQTTRLTAANYVKHEIRRQRREQEAYMQSTLNEPGSETWNEIAPFLDEAMGGLGETDRNAVVLKFFENKTAREVATALKLTEAAAHKRINRALEKLRKFLTKRGVVSTTAIIAGAVSANSVHAAPVGLTQTISTVALAKGAAVSTSTLTLVKGALKLMAWSKAKIAIAVGVGILFAAGATTVVTVNEIHHVQNDEWQLANIDTKYLVNLPYQTVILPTKAAQRNKKNGTGGGASIGDGRTYGVNASLEEMLRCAFTQPHANGFYYDEASPVRTIFDTKLPARRYDYFSNLPKGSREALQLEIRKKFGLSAEYHTIETNVLLLEVNYPNSAGLKPTSHKDLGSNYRDGDINANNQTMESLAQSLETDLGVPVIDQTGLTNSYDFNLEWHNKIVKRNINGIPLSHDGNPNLGEMEQALADQLGLELVPTNMPIDMLVVEKAQ
jgi:RNA polymerase sigma factor (sigma-70 family)